MKKKVLITGATGQVGSRTIDRLSNDKEIEIVAAGRSPQKATSFADRGLARVILDLNNETTHPGRRFGFCIGFASRRIRTKRSGLLKGEFR